MGNDFHKSIAQARAHLRRENAKHDETFKRIDEASWPPGYAEVTPGNEPVLHRIAVFRSRHFMVQMFSTSSVPIECVAGINRTWLRDDGHFEDGITWDDLMAIKRGIGLGERQAIEVFPEDRNMVYRANMRWLWFPRERLNWFWEK